MNKVESILTVISILGTASSIMFSFMAFRRANKKEDKQDGRNERIIMSDIGYIKSSTERIEKRLEKLEVINTDVNTRVVVLENEVKNLKSRLTLVKETR